MPARASRKPSIMPAGPPPAMQQVVLTLVEVIAFAAFGPPYTLAIARTSG
jgi:hypothetical protein